MSEENIINGVNYGPLAVLVGAWKGDKGKDLSPNRMVKRKPLILKPSHLKLSAM